MSSPPTDNITGLLALWRSGDQQALAALTPIVYRELHRIAEGYLAREWRNHTLQPTELIHEAYLRLVDQNQLFNSRSHFYGVAAHLMRLILVDHARSRAAGKRGGVGDAFSLSAIQVAAPERPADLLALDEALSRLAEFDARKCRAVELRFFGGMSLDEIADVLGISIPTAVRDLRAAQTWLHRELTRANTERTSSDS